MTRVVSTLVIMMLLLNGSVGIMAASGLSEDLGVELAPGVGASMDKLVSNMKDGFSPNIGVIESLINMFVAALGIFELLANALFAAPTMLINLGFPEWAVTALFAPVYLITTLEMIFVATGRGLV